MRGLVLGKFYPLHAGHERLIAEARKRCTDLTILIGGSISESIPLEVRYRWLLDRYKGFPDIEVRMCWDEIPDDFGDDEVWIKHIVLFQEALGTHQPDVIFSSERYGDELANRMDCRHELIDINRDIVPISASVIRAYPVPHWPKLNSDVQAYLAKRIVIIGAESTGTTTLAKDLANELDSPFFVEEYGRKYSEENLQGDSWKDSDFVQIAARQQRREQDLAHASGPYLICDTNAWATQLWQEYYMGHVSPDVQWIAEQCKADLYILTNEDIPYVQDGTRDGGPMIRRWMNQEFRERLAYAGVPWIEVRGTPGVRVEQAKRAVQKLQWRFSKPLTTEKGYL